MNISRTEMIGAVKFLLPAIGIEDKLMKKTERIKMYNFERRWNREIKPLLENDEELRNIAMTCVLRCYNELKYSEDFLYCVMEQIKKRPYFPPVYAAEDLAERTKIIINNGGVHIYSMEAHIMKGRCFWIEPFTRALGERIYPHLRWESWKSPRHAISVGCGCGIIIVMDLLVEKWNKHALIASLDYACPSINNQKWVDRLTRLGAAKKDIEKYIPKNLDNYLSKYYSKNDITWTYKSELK